MVPFAIVTGPGYANTSLSVYGIFPNTGICAGTRRGVLSEWPSSKNLQTINAGEGVEKREPSCTVGGNVN